MDYTEHKKVIDRIMKSQIEHWFDGIIKSYRVKVPTDDDHICKLIIELSEKNDIETEEHYNIFKLELELDLQYTGTRYYYEDEYENKYHIYDQNELNFLILQFLLDHIDRLQSILEKERYYHNKEVIR